MMLEEGEYYFSTTTKEMNKKNAIWCCPWSYDQYLELKSLLLKNLDLLKHAGRLTARLNKQKTL